MTAPAGRALRLSGHGFIARLPSPWEGRIYRRATPTANFANPAMHVPGRFGISPARAGWAGESVHPIMHLANFALPPARGDFGTGAVEQMTPDDVFLALLEYGRDFLGTPLYAPIGIPYPQSADFSANALQRRIAGQCGYQRFFTVNKRAMCLYVVLGSQRAVTTLSREVRDVLDTVEVLPV